MSRAREAADRFLDAAVIVIAVLIACVTLGIIQWNFDNLDDQ